MPSRCWCFLKTLEFRGLEFKTTYVQGNLLVKAKPGESGWTKGGRRVSGVGRVSEAERWRAAHHGGGHFRRWRLPEVQPVANSPGTHWHLISLMQGRPVRPYAPYALLALRPIGPSAFPNLVPSLIL